MPKTSAFETLSKLQQWKIQFACGDIEIYLRKSKWKSNKSNDEHLSSLQGLIPRI